MVQVARKNAAADSVKHAAIPVAREKKRELLSYLVQTRDLKQVLVFTATRLGANRLAYQLNRDGVHATAIHGDKSQPERLIALNDFKEGKVRVLVATDVAARGLDIEDLPHVINFDLPNSPEDYVHRIGRTGRAGASGEAISLVSPEEHERLEAIEKTIRVSIPREMIPGFGMDSRAVSSLVPHAPHGDSRRERSGDALSGSRRERPPRDRDRPRSPPAQGARRAAASADPIFLEPYRPAASPPPASARSDNAAARPSGKPAVQIAALLGGLRLKTK